MSLVDTKKRAILEQGDGFVCLKMKKSLMQLMNLFPLPLDIIHRPESHDRTVNKTETHNLKETGKILAGPVIRRATDGLMALDDAAVGVIEVGVCLERVS